jgi:hypothetical protein
MKDGRIVFTPKPEAGVDEFASMTVLDRLLAGVIPQEHAVPQAYYADITQLVLLNPKFA